MRPKQVMQHGVHSKKQEDITCQYQGPVVFNPVDDPKWLCNISKSNKDKSHYEIIEFSFFSP